MRWSPLDLTYALALLSAVPQWAVATDLKVTGAWARPTPPSASVGAVYLSIANGGQKEDRLLAVSSPIAVRVEIHETQAVEGVMQMRQVSSVACPAGATVRIRPGGLHIMLLGLKRPLTLGSRLDLTLRFREAGSVSIQVPVQDGPDP